MSNECKSLQKLRCAKMEGYFSIAEPKPARELLFWLMVVGEGKSCQFKINLGASRFSSFSFFWLGGKCWSIKKVYLSSFSFPSPLRQLKFWRSLYVFWASGMRYLVCAIYCWWSLLDVYWVFKGANKKILLSSPKLWSAEL